MTSTLLFALLAAAVAAKFVSRAYWSNRLDRVRELQELRERFARCRRETIRLIDMGQLAPDSVTFRFLYITSSALVRRTHDYPAFAQGFMMSLLEAEYQPRSEMVRLLTREMETWTPDVREVCFSLTTGIVLMVERFYPPLRLLTRVERLGLMPFLKLVLNRIPDPQRGREIVWVSQELEQRARAAHPCAA